MNWDEMSPRERDALVAEKVMGFHWGDLDNGNEALMPPFNEFPWCLTSMHVYDSDGYHTGMPHYTTSISDAWQVVEKMKGSLFSGRQRFLNELQRAASGGKSGLKDGEMIAWPNVFMFIGPQNICVAALRAVGVQI